MSNEQEFREIMAERAKTRTEKRAYDEGYENGGAAVEERLQDRCDCTCGKCGCCR